MILFHYPRKEEEIEGPLMSQPALSPANEKGIRSWSDSGRAGGVRLDDMAWPWLVVPLVQHVVAKRESQPSSCLTPAPNTTWRGRGPILIPTNDTIRHLIRSSLVS